MDISKLGEVISTDVLVIGGGLSGLMAGIKSRESDVDTLVVDRGGIGAYWWGNIYGHISRG